MSLSRTEKAALWKNRTEVAATVTEAVAAEYGVTKEALLGRGKVEPLPSARHEVMARLWERGWGLSETGRVLGFDHTSVQYGVRKVLGDEYARLSPKLSPGPGRRPVAA